MSESTAEVLEVPPGQRRERADKVLAAHLEGWSRSRVQKLFAAGMVWRDDEAIDKSTMVNPGDALIYTVPPPRPLELRPVDIPLDVLLEDEDIVAVNKPAGMVVHPGAGTGEDTLVHALLHHCRGKLSGIGGVERPGIVHRLDRETSGVIVAAKSDRGYHGMARLFADRRLEKHYLALVSGVPIQSSGVIEAPIGRHPVHRTRMSVREDGRTARSDWNVVEVFAAGFALLSVRIHTGRTHQIRVHLSHLGHPLAGDSTYGFRKDRTEMHIPRVMLHAVRLSFCHPISHQDVVLEAPVPPDFAAVLEALSP